MRHVFVWTVSDVIGLIMLGIAFLIALYTIIEYYIKRIKSYRKKS